MRCVRVTTVAVEKQRVLHILIANLQPSSFGMQSACAVLFCHLWPVWLYYTFPHYLISGMIFEKKFTEHKMRIFISLKRMSKTFMILRKIQRAIKNAHFGQRRAAYTTVVS